MSDVSLTNRTAAQTELQAIENIMDNCAKHMAMSLNIAWRKLWLNRTPGCSAQELFDEAGPIQSAKLLFGGQVVVAALQDIVAKKNLIAMLEGKEPTYTIEGSLPDPRMGTTLHPIEIDPTTGAITVIYPEVPEPPEPPEDDLGPHDPPEDEEET